MSFLKSLFGGGKAAGGASSRAPKGPRDAEVVKTEEYEGFLIEARPYEAEGGYQVAGIVAKVLDAESDGNLEEGAGTTRREHAFIRSDRLPTREQAADEALRKGRLIISERGERVFD